MSSLETIQEFLDSKCLCHEGSDLEFALESLPKSIRQPKVKLGCDCRHGQEKDIKRAFRQFKTFILNESQFKVGDRVELAITPIITEETAHGWLGSKHFLVEGARGTIHEVEYRDGFGYSVEFDEESWKDRDGVVHPTTNKHVYHFSEEKLRKASNITTRAFLKQLWHDFAKIGD